MKKPNCECLNDLLKNSDHEPDRVRVVKYVFNPFLSFMIVNKGKTKPERFRCQRIEIKCCPICGKEWE
jgi:hypothetical protein